MLTVLTPNSEGLTPLQAPPIAKERDAVFFAVHCVYCCTVWLNTIDWRSPSVSLRSLVLDATSTTAVPSLRVVLVISSMSTSERSHLASSAAISSASSASRNNLTSASTSDSRPPREGLVLKSTVIRFATSAAL